MLFSFFFFNDTATTEIYTLSLHDALPICIGRWTPCGVAGFWRLQRQGPTFPHGPQSAHGRTGFGGPEDRKSTRLNSSHLVISYAVFCLKKKTARSLWATSCPI